MAHFPLLLRILFSGCYKRVDELPQKLIRRNAPYDQTCSKVSTRSVYPYARETFAKKATARRTHTHTDRLFKITFLDVLWIVHPKSGLIENSISSYDANTSMGHGSKTDESCRCSPSEQTAGIVRAKEIIALWCRQKSPLPKQKKSPLVSSGTLFVWVHFRAEFFSKQRFW